MQKPEGYDYSLAVARDILAGKHGAEHQIAFADMLGYPRDVLAATLNDGSPISGGASVSNVVPNDAGTFPAWLQMPQTAQPTPQNTPVVVSSANPGGSSSVPAEVAQALFSMRDALAATMEKIEQLVTEVSVLKQFKDEATAAIKYHHGVIAGTVQKS